MAESRKSRKKFVGRRRKPFVAPEFNTGYEKYVDLLNGYHRGINDHLNSQRGELYRRIAEAKKDLKKDLKRPFLSEEGKSAHRDIIENGVKNFAAMLEPLADVRKPLNDSHLFMLGPATSDSLFRFKPTDYQYIENGRLPFDNCYFDLNEPLEVKVPGIGLDGLLEGVQISNQQTEEMRNVLSAEEFKEVEKSRPEMLDSTLRRCDMTAYMDIPGRGSGIFNMSFEVSAVKTFAGASLYLPFFHDRISYDTVLTEGDDESTGFDNMDFDNMDFEVAKAMHNYEPIPFWGTREEGARSEIRDIKNVDLGDASKFIGSLYGFGVNMINYVNSHNVTVVQKEGRNPPKNSRNPHSKPYNLITLKDEVKYVSEGNEGTGTELEYQIYVRGHPRRYRDEDGLIRKVSWVVPHIKGPEGAPWREQKYQVLAAKLIRERKFNERFGIAEE